MKRWIMGSSGGKKSTESQEEYIERVYKRYRRRETLKYVMTILGMTVIYIVAIVLMYVFESVNV